MHSPFNQIKEVCKTLSQGGKQSPGACSDAIVLWDQILLFSNRVAFPGSAGGTRTAFRQHPFTPKSAQQTGALCLFCSSEPLADLPLPGAPSCLPVWGAQYPAGCRASPFLLAFGMSALSCYYKKTLTSTFRPTREALGSHRAHPHQKRTQIEYQQLL